MEKRKNSNQIGEILEKDIFKLLGQAKLLLNFNPVLGIKIFRRADALYRLRGYDFETECEMNNIYLIYLENYRNSI